jgi:hypothetical protein
MDWDPYYLVEHVELLHKEEEDELSLYCRVTAGKNDFKHLLDGATQISLGYEGGEHDAKSIIAFRLSNANGELFIGIAKKDWGIFLEQPDTIFFIYGEGDQELLQTTFLNLLFEDFLDRMIERYNKGETDPFIHDVVEVFAEEEGNETDS